MSIPFQKIAAYYRACYQADNREINLPYFLSTKINLAYFLENTDLLEGHMPMHPVDEAWYTKVTHQLEAYAKEKELYMGSHFLMGYGLYNGKKQRVCAPLFLHPAYLLADKGLHYVEIDSKRRVFNPSFVRLLKTEENDESELYAKIQQAIPDGHINFEKNTAIKDALQAFFPNLNWDDMQVYPKVPNEEQLRAMLTQAAKSKTQAYRLVPVQILGLLRKSAGTQGVLNELEDMAEQTQFSAPLQCIFAGKPPKTKRRSQDQIYVPAHLSAAQSELFESVREHSLSCVVGPPGTGKSFTIAALAIDYLSRGKSVLIASSNNQAVDVVADKIDFDFGLKNVVIRGGRQDYKKQLKHRLEALLSGMEKTKPNRQLIKSLTTTTNKLHKRIKAYETFFEQWTQKEMRRGKILEEEGVWASLQKKWIGLTTHKTATPWDLLQQYQTNLERYNKSVKRLIQERFDRQLTRTLKENRQQLTAFNKAIRARTATRKEQQFRHIDFKGLTKTFPIWLASLSEVSNILPLRPQMFDLVIIDEATQCDVATAIPVLQRGQKAVVCGDPKQLRHVSFLSGQRQQLLQQQHQLDTFDAELLNYRSKSLLDVVSDTITHQNQVVFLNEHYRSTPHIISFSNQAFYNGRLNIIKSSPNALREKRVFVHHCHGNRDKEGYNYEEAMWIMDKLKEILQEDENLSDEKCRSIGVLSPFRKQVDRIAYRIDHSLSHEQIKRHKLLVGTAHSFQGEERDVMLLSFVLDNQAHATAFRHLNREDVFNVSITRAKAEQHLCISLSPEKLKNDWLLGQYLHHVKHFPTKQLTIDNKDEKDAFLADVKQSLHQLGQTDVLVACPVAGIKTDLLFVHNKKNYCIDLVGHPGKYAQALSLEQYNMLSRVGIQVFPLSYTVWYFQRDLTLKALKRFIHA